MRALEKDGKAQPAQLFVMDLAGGEPRPLTDLPRGASSPAWAPDGRSVYFISDEPVDGKPQEFRAQLILERLYQPFRQVVAVPLQQVRGVDRITLVEPAFFLLGDQFLLGSGSALRAAPTPHVVPGR